MTQEEAYQILYPLIEQNGKLYCKCSLVYVYKAKEGEYIETWTADGLETTNYSKVGDFVVQNLQTECLEQYIIPEDIFFKRYEFFYFTGEGAVYKPTGKIKAAKYCGEDLQFVAKWGRLMSLKTGDFLATPYPECNEIYRIANQEFFETYEEDL